MEEIFTITNGTRPAVANGEEMKRTRQFPQIIKTRSRLSLGDLILAVGSCTGSRREMVAAVADLLASGKVRVHNNGRFLRARVC